jgi:hypothetical protein
MDVYFIREGLALGANCDMMVEFMRAWQARV